MIKIIDKYKKVSAYVNTTRIHWLVEELQNVGIVEIMVTEYFRPLSQISKVEFYCDEHLINDISKIIHRVGSRGSCDHLIDIKEVTGNPGSIFPFV